MNGTRSFFRFLSMIRPGVRRIGLALFLLTMGTVAGRADILPVDEEDTATVTPPADFPGEGANYSWTTSPFDLNSLVHQINSGYQLTFEAPDVSATTDLTVTFTWNNPSTSQSGSQTTIYRVTDGPPQFHNMPSFVTGDIGTIATIPVDVSDPNPLDRVDLSIGGTSANGCSMGPTSAPEVVCTVLPNAYSVTIFAHDRGGSATSATVQIRPANSVPINPEPTQPAALMTLPVNTVVGGAAFAMPMSMERTAKTNHLPVLPSVTMVGNPGSPVTVTLNPTDADNDAVTIIVDTPTAYGFLQISGNQLTYTPMSSRTGTDAAILRLFDGEGYSLTAVNIRSGTPSAAPTVTPLNLTTAFNTSLGFSVSMTGGVGLVRLTPPTYGSIAGPASGATFQPQTGLFGPSSFGSFADTSNGVHRVATVHTITVRDPALTYVSVMDGQSGPEIARVNNPAYGTQTINLNAAALSDGAHTLVAEAQDVTGAIGRSSGLYIVDSTPPQCAYRFPKTPAEFSFVSGTIGLSVFAQDDRATPPLNDKIGETLLSEPRPGTPTKKYAATTSFGVYELSSYNTIGIPDGLNSFRTTCTDIFNNPRTATIQLNVDNTAPALGALTVTPITLGADNVMNGTRTLRATATDNVSGMDTLKLVLKSAANELPLTTASGGTASFLLDTTLPAYADGAWEFRATATDKLGNTTTTSRPIVIDNTPPRVRIQSPANGASGLTSVSQIQFSLLDDLHGIRSGSVVATVDGQVVNGTLSGLVFNLSAPITAPGSHVLKVQAQDNAGVPGNVGSDQTIFSVSAVNRPPTADAQTITSLEDAPIIITLSGFDLDGNPLTYSVVNSPSHGTVGQQNNQFITYTPASNYNGPDSFTFKVGDGSLFSAPATVSITVLPVNDAPIASSLPYTLNQDATVDVVPSATDVDGDALTYTVLTRPTHGNLTLVGSGPTQRYAPNPGYSGTDLFTYLANDGKTNSNTATVSFTVNAINHAPVASRLNVTSLVTGQTPLTLLAQDADGDTLTYTIVDLPSHGTVSPGTTANRTYTPQPGYTGLDSFSFQASDGKATSNKEVVTMLVVSVVTNHAPTALPDTVSAVDGTPLSITLQGTDSDAGDTLTVSIIESTTHGTLTGLGANWTYTAFVPYSGSDRIRFRVTDNHGLDSDVAAVSINVSHVNHLPMALEQSLVTLKNVAKLVTLTANDRDGDAPSFTVVTPPAHGTHSLATQGGITTVLYTPAPNYVGNDSFSFQASDAQGPGPSAIVTIQVNAANNPPTADDKAVVTGQGTPITFTVVARDPDGDTLSYVPVDLPTHGGLTGGGPSYTYSPTTSFSGTDQFTFRVRDSNLAESNTARVSFTVNAVDQPPTISFVNPTNNGSVGGDVQIQMLAHDNESVPTVTLSIDGATPVPATRTNGDVYTYTWKTGDLPAMSHTLRAFVTDSKNVSRDQTVTVMVDNASPSVEAFVPLKDALVTGMFVVQAAASDNQGVARIELHLLSGSNDTLLTSVNGPNLTYSWDTSALPDGSYSLQVLVIDKAGNGVLRTNAITVQNAGSGTRPQFSVIEPQPNAAVRGVVRVAARLIEGTPDQFQATLDQGQTWPLVREGTSDVYVLSWDTTNGLPDGNHILEIAAIKGTVATRTSVNVVVDNTRPDVQITSPLPSQVLFLKPNLISNVTDATLDTVVFSIGTRELAVFAAGSGSLYSYALDTQRVDPVSNEPEFENGRSYQLTVTAKDRAGNTRSVSVPFVIDNGNIPESTGVLTPSIPDRGCTTTGAPTLLSIAFENVVIDPLMINDDSIKVYTYENAEPVRLNGNVSLTGNRATFSAALPNRYLHVDVAFLDANRKALRKSWDILPGVPSDQGAVVAGRDGRLSVSIPAGALPVSACVDIEAEPSADEGINAPTTLDHLLNGHVYAGPYRIEATAHDGTAITDFLPGTVGTLAFNERVANIPPADRPNVFGVEYFQDGWRSLDRGPGSSIGGTRQGTKAEDPAQSRIVSAFVRRFGLFRITSAAAPGPGITGVFSYPNPFSPANGDAKLTYMLGADSNVIIVIYDLLGNLVRKADLSAGSDSARLGVNTWVWNGRNGAGEMVGNGGYIVKIYATDSQGTRYSQTWKMAVAK